MGGICPKLPNPSDFLHVKLMNVMTTLEKNLQFWICFHHFSPTFLCPIQLRNRRQKAVCSPHFSKGKSPEKLDYHRVFLLLPPNKKISPPKNGPQITCAPQKRSLAPQINWVHFNKQPFRLGTGGTGVLGVGTGDRGLGGTGVLGVGTGDRGLIHGDGLQ